MTESPSRSDYHIGGNMGGNFLGFFAEDEEPELVNKMNSYLA